MPKKKNKFLDHIKKLREYVRNSKCNPCTDCKIKYGYWVMQYDHINPKNKKDAISDLIKKGVSFEVLLAEIEKCELVCANCHAEREQKRKKHA